jgi:cell division protein FtsZ
MLRLRQAEQALSELKRCADTVIVVPNERLLSVVGRTTSFRDALKKADEVLLHATQGISDLISVTGEVNVDFADVRTVMANRGPALMGTGFGQGENRAVEAAQEAISSPLLDDLSIKNAAGVLINITGGMDLTIDEVTTIASIIQEAAGDESEIIFGAVHDPDLEGEVRVTAIATGLVGADEPSQSNIIRPNFPARGAASMPAFAGSAGSPAGSGAGAGAGTGTGTGTASSARSTPAPEALPFQRSPERIIVRQQLTDLDIPTFIRRQMD